MPSRCHRCMLPAGRACRAWITSKPWPAPTTAPSLCYPWPARRRQSRHCPACAHPTPAGFWVHRHPGRTIASVRYHRCYHRVAPWSSAVRTAWRRHDPQTLAHRPAARRRRGARASRISGCRPTSARARGIQRRLSKYIDASIGDAEVLNPILNADTVSNRIVGLVFEGLLDLDADLHLRGRIATDWGVTEEASSWSIPSAASRMVRR